MDGQTDKQDSLVFVTYNIRTLQDTILPIISPFMFQNGCNRTGEVCGIDGNTYSSECAAWARYIHVDYPGGCIAVGLIQEIAVQQCNDKIINCPPLARPDCMGVTPPGACCPVCAGALRVLYR